MFIANSSFQKVELRHRQSLTSPREEQYTHVLVVSRKASEIDTVRKNTIFCMSKDFDLIQIRGLALMFANILEGE